MQHIMSAAGAVTLAYALIAIVIALVVLVSAAAAIATLAALRRPNPWKPGWRPALPPVQRPRRSLFR